MITAPPSDRPEIRTEALRQLGAELGLDAGGSSAVACCLATDAVGSESSSATNGSSMASVAGKKRCPTTPCARAVVADAARRIPSAPRHCAIVCQGERSTECDYRLAQVTGMRHDVAGSPGSSPRACWGFRRRPGGLSMNCP